MHFVKQRKFLKIPVGGQEWWHAPLLPCPGGEDCTVEARLDNIERCCLLAKELHEAALYFLGSIPNTAEKKSLWDKF